MNSTINSYTADAMPTVSRSSSGRTGSIKSRKAAGARRSPPYFLLQVALCALPASILLVFGRPWAAGLCFWLVVGVCAIRFFVIGKADHMLCFILAVSPFINLLRQSAFYNIVIVLLISALLFSYIKTPKAFRLTLHRFPLAIPLLGYLTLYYVSSLIITNDYARNLRMFELGFVVIIVLTIGRRPALLSSALRGLTLSAIAVGLAMLPNLGSVADERLGSVIINGQLLGNPILLGLPLALSFLALSVEKGKWVDLQANHLYRFGLLACTAILLALTTSRAAWAVAVCGIIITLVFGSGQRFRMVLVIILAALAIQVILASSYKGGFQRGVDRTLGEDRTATNRTSGRSEQWVVAYYAFTESMGTVLRGYGPGTGPEIYAKESAKVPNVAFKVGEKMELHSLIMQIGVEAGLLGLIPFAIWTLVVLFKVQKWARKSRLVFPLICFAGYLIIVATVSGNDMTSGFFLGIGLLGTMRLPVREVVRSYLTPRRRRRTALARAPQRLTS